MSKPDIFICEFQNHVGSDKTKLYFKYNMDSKLLYLMQSEDSDISLTRSSVIAIFMNDGIKKLEESLSNFYEKLKNFDTVTLDENVYHVGIPNKFDCEIKKGTMDFYDDITFISGSNGSILPSGTSAKIAWELKFKYSENTIVSMLIVEPHLDSLQILKNFVTILNSQRNFL